MQYADRHCSYQEKFIDGQHCYIFSGPCVVTGKIVVVKIPGEELYAYRQGEYIQNAMKSLSPGEREFLISGMSEEAFDATMKPDDG